MKVFRMNHAYNLSTGKLLKQRISQDNLRILTLIINHIITKALIYIKMKIINENTENIRIF